MHHERTEEEEEKKILFFQETFSDLFFSGKKGIFSVVDPINHGLLKFGRNASLSKTWHTKKENFERRQNSCFLFPRKIPLPSKSRKLKKALKVIKDPPPEKVPPGEQKRVRMWYTM